MKVLVTGASGFAGRAITAALRREGHTVRALVRASTAEPLKQRLTHLGAALVDGDVTREPTLLDAAKGMDAVVHAARLDDPRAPRAQLEAVNLVGTENLLAAARAAGVKRVVHLSTADVTQSMAPRAYVDEEHPQPPSFLDARTETRALAEDLVVAASDAAMETVTLRAAWLWGADDTHLAPWLVKAAHDGTFTWVDGGRSLCATTHARNLASATLLALTHADAPAKVFYVTDDERITAREFFTRLAAALGVKLPRRDRSLWLSVAAAWITERLGGAPSPTRAELAAWGRTAHFNVQRLRTELGWAPAVDVSTGLQGVARWAQAVGVKAIEDRAVAPDAPDA